MKLLITVLHPAKDLAKPRSKAPCKGDDIYWCNDKQYLVECPYQGTLAPIGMTDWGSVGDGFVIDAARIHPKVLRYLSIHFGIKA